jgi:hypothetical protein
VARILELSPVFADADSREFPFFDVTRRATFGIPARARRAYPCQRSHA